MKYLLVILLGLLAIVSANSYLESIGNEEWQAFKIKYDKKYKNVREHIERLKIFLENKRHIVEHNKLYAAGKVTFEMGINEFADLTHEEFSHKMLSNAKTLNALQRRHKEMPQHRSSVNMILPDSVDWRKEGAVTAVKSQSGCNACWAFAAIATLESMHYIKTGQLVTLSEQNLIDCTRNYYNFGCTGGWIDTSYDYIKENGGINDEFHYGYQAREYSCRYNSNYIAATVLGYRTIKPNNETEMMHALATVGPISIYMNSGSHTFQYYKSGVYGEPNCPTDSFTHTASIVGYGTDAREGDYWLVKNSWRPSWGESGYFRIARNKNMCGIASAPLYPIV